MINHRTKVVQTKKSLDKLECDESWTIIESLVSPATWNLKTTRVAPTSYTMRIRKTQGKQYDHK